MFLVLPPERLATYARWLRLMVAHSLQELARESAKPAAPVLYLLDAFAALGALTPVERAMGLMAGYGSDQDRGVTINGTKSYASHRPAPGDDDGQAGARIRFGRDRRP